MISLTQILHEERIDLRSTASGMHATTCPECSHKRKKHNQRKPCLSVKID